MSSVKWTENQADAINARDGSVLVSAAAGSGKTAVLVQRVIDTITDKINPVSIDRMLIVTFTRAASAEMRTRVDKALNKLLQSDPYNSYLLRQKQLLYSARISTIDGFCTDFVRQYFYKLGIRQDFRIADNKELNLIQNKALDNTLEYFYNEQSTDFLKTVNALCSYRSDNNLRDTILEIYDFLVTIPFMDSWLDNALNAYDVDKTPVATAPYVKYLLTDVNEGIAYSKSLLENIKAILDNDTYFTEKQLSSLRTMVIEDEEIINNIHRLVQNSDWDELYNSLNTVSFKRFPTLRGCSDDSPKSSIQAIRKSYQSEIAKASKLVYKSLSDIEAETRKMYPVINGLFGCIKRYHEEFSAIKRDKNVADFHDIENFMIKLLCVETDNGIEYTDTAKEISEMFDCIMVDEFQDVNEVQNLIFRALSKNEENLFMVGDVKQSIYGFRQAKPEIFINYKNRYKAYSRAMNSYPAKIILDRNFRSRYGVLEACNFVFENIMSPMVGGLEYNEEEKLFCGASYPDTDMPQMEVNIVDTSDVDKANDETSEEVEAWHAGHRILELIYKEKVTVKDGDSQRPLTFGDIAILLRSPKGSKRVKKAVVYANVLNSMGIPATASEKNSFFDLYEVKIMLNMLRVIDNPVQDIPVLSVMMSPIFGFTPDDMAEIRSNNKKVPIYNAVLSLAKTNAKCKGFIETIARLRKISVTTTVDKLIGIICNITGFQSMVMALNGGTVGNLNLLREYAASYGANGYKTLSAFISFIDRLQSRGLDLDAEENSDSGNLNTVRIMSIHASKGLEFPVCFICSTATSFNTQDTIQDVVLNDSGVGVRYKEDYLKFDTIQRKASALALSNSFISEEMRVLYVAMTRAKERLIITFAQDKPIEYLCSINSKITDNKLSTYAVKNCRSISDWITACSLLHPSCGKWRKLCSSSIVPVDTRLLPWKFTIRSRADLMKINSKEEINSQSSDTTDSVEDTEFLENLKDRINFKYENQHLTKLPQKVSASDLAHKDSEIFDKVLRTPGFISDKEIKGTDRGTAFHTFMEHCDLKTAYSDVSLEADNLVIKGFLTEEQRDLLDINKISSLMNTPEMLSAINSQECYREYQFTVKIDLKDYDSTLNNSPKEKIVMQGAVDLAYVDNGELVIIDYKTDRVKEASQLAAMYSKQLELYKTAMEQCTGYPVKKMYIYSLNLNEFILIN